MKNALAKLALFLAVAASLCGIGYYLFARNQTSNINALLPQADAALSKKDYRQTMILLNRIHRRPLSRYDYARILKRAYQMSLETNSFAYLEKEAKRAANSIKGAEEFWAFYVLALLENKNYKKADAIAQRRLAGEDFFSLKSQAALSVSNKAAADPLEAAENRLYEQEDAQYYEDTAALMKSAPLYFDAAILWLRAGQKEKARTLLPFMQTPEVPSLGRAFIAYDTGDYQNALSELQAQPSNGSDLFEQTVLLADTHAAMKDQRLAYEYYMKALSLNPSARWQTWLNAALLGDTLKDGSDKALFLQTALRYFPNQKDLLLAYAWFQPDRDDVQARMESFLELAPYDADVSIYWLNHFAPAAEPKLYASKLWDLFNHDMRNAQLAQYMIWFLLGVESSKEAQLVLNRYAGNNKEWMDFYQGLVRIGEKRYQEASVLFQKQKNWQNYYNLAMINLYYDQGDLALQNLRSAETVYSRIAPSQKEMAMQSQIQSKIALAYYKNGNLDAARKTAQAALEYDSNNFEARQIMRDSYIQ